MKPISPVIPDKNMPEVIVAEHQEEYQNLPAIRLEGGVILCRWKLDEEERKKVFETGGIYLLQWTNDGLVTPMLLQTDPPEISTPTPEPVRVQMMTCQRRSANIVNQAKQMGFELFEDNCSECTCVCVFTQATRETMIQQPDLKVICKVCFQQMQQENPQLEGVYLENTKKEMETLAQSVL